jgi:hypothetical protein
LWFWQLGAFVGFACGSNTVEKVSEAVMRLICFPVVSNT